MSLSFMVSTGGADVQIIAIASCILVDIQNRDSSRLRCGHALAGLSVEDAVRLGGALNEAIVVAAIPDPRQASLWPEAR
jgi:hypothetical protein